MVIQSIANAINGPLPTRFEHFDLRFFSKIELGDTYNGRPNPDTGYRYSIILYGTKVVHTFRKHYNNGRGEMSDSSGLEGSTRFYEAAKLYLQIQEIGRVKYHRLLDEEKVMAADPTWDIIAEGPTFSLLKTHPQYHALVQDLRIAFQLVDGGHENDRRISVWAHSK